MLVRHSITNQLTIDMVSDTCAVCLDALSTVKHVAASNCSKPYKPGGHQPVICWTCMLEVIKTNSTCPLCRGTLTTLHKFTLELLDANASTQDALESVHVRSLTHSALTFSASVPREDGVFTDTGLFVIHARPDNLAARDALWGRLASGLFASASLDRDVSIDREVIHANSRRRQARSMTSVILGVCAQCNMQLVYTTHHASVQEGTQGACDATVHHFVQALVGMNAETPIRVNFPALDPRATGTYSLRAVVSMLRQHDMLSAEWRVGVTNSVTAEWMLEVANRSANAFGLIHESIYVTPILPAGHAFGRCAFCLHALVIPDGTGDEPPCSASIHQFHRFRFDHGVTIDMGRPHMGRDFRRVCDTFDSARLCLLRVLQPRDLLAARFNVFHSRWNLTRTPSSQ